MDLMEAIGYYGAATYSSALPGRESDFDKAKQALEVCQHYADRLKAAEAVIAEQAEEEALWCIADNIVEAYLQQELRRLTAAIEGKP